MNTREESYIVALNHFRSITKAAEYLHVSQPTLSIFLNNLEKQIGVPLFERIGKKIIPTAVGEIYVRQASEILALEHSFARELQPYISGDRGELHVGSTYRGCLPALPKLLRHMHELYPEVLFHLHDESTGQLEPMLANGQLDSIYTNSPIQNRQFHVEKLHQDHLVLVLPEDHPACAFATTIEGMNYPYLDLKHVKSETFFMLEPDHVIRDRADMALAYAGIQPARIHLTGHIEVGCLMAAEGLGVAFTMEHYISCGVPSRPVRYFRVGNPNAAVNWVLAYRNSEFQPQYLTDFIQLMKREYQR